MEPSQLRCLWGALEGRVLKAVVTVTSPHSPVCFPQAGAEEHHLFCPTVPWALFLQDAAYGGGERLRRLVCLSWELRF